MIQQIRITSARKKRPLDCVARIDRTGQSCCVNHEVGCSGTVIKGPLTSECVNVWVERGRLGLLDCSDKVIQSAGLAGLRGGDFDVVAEVLELLPWSTGSHVCSSSVSAAVFRLVTRAVHGETMPVHSVVTFTAVSLTFNWRLGRPVAMARRRVRRVRSVCGFRY